MNTLASAACALLLLGSGASAQIPPGSLASNVRVVGYSDVGGRPPFKLSIRQANGRWYLYAGHLWHRGWTILDVTDPAKPTVANFIRGPENTWTIQMEIGGDKMITALEKIGQGWGGDDGKPNDEGVLVWSLAEPVRPKRLGQGCAQFDRCGHRATRRPDARPMGASCRGTIGFNRALDRSRRSEAISGTGGGQRGASEWSHADHKLNHKRQ